MSGLFTGLAGLTANCQSPHSSASLTSKATVISRESLRLGSVGGLSGDGGGVASPGGLRVGSLLLDKTCAISGI